MAMRDGGRLTDLEQFYPESRYGGFSAVDGNIAFFSRVNALIQKDDTILDVGCGRGAQIDDSVEFRRSLRVLKGRCREVIGIDVDAAGNDNPCIDSFRLISGDKWPIADASIDLCICDHVVEHIANPGKFFTECSRVLKVGGYLCIRTPSAYSYVALASRIIPNRHHATVLSRVQHGRDAKDIFPTYYRYNTVGRLRRTLSESGFEDCVVLPFEAEPSYLDFSRFFYRLGVLHQRFAPPWMKPSLFAFSRKRSYGFGRRD